MTDQRLIRGFEELIPEEQFEKRLQKKLRVKLGVDPTGTELHLGHAVIFNKLKQFQDAGHTIVFIIGDFTARIGDPSGRDKTRPPLTADDVRENARTYQEQLFRILDRQRVEVLYNNDWLGVLGTDGLVDLASRYTVARMLERDDFSNRFENQLPIRLHEFLYPLLQGWDSVQVRADIEIGGTDQKFNLLVGRQLQKQEGQQPQLVGTLPILPGTDGQLKMSKSYNNHIPLDAPGTEMYGKLMSVPDQLISDYLRLLTDLAETEIVELEQQLSQGINPKEIKKRMAYVITERYRGSTEAQRGEQYFARTAEQSQLPSAADIEKYLVSPEDNPVWIVELLERCGLAESRSQAKRLLKQGAVRLDGRTIEGFDEDIDATQKPVLQVGKQSYRRVELD